jgi:hypothetical protein
MNWRSWGEEGRGVELVAGGLIAIGGRRESKCGSGSRD